MRLFSDFEPLWVFSKGFVCLLWSNMKCFRMINERVSDDRNADLKSSSRFILKVKVSLRQNYIVLFIFFPTRYAAKYFGYRR